jgi:hypothetical protein
MERNEMKFQANFVGRQLNAIGIMQRFSKPIEAESLQKAEYLFWSDIYTTHQDIIQLSFDLIQAAPKNPRSESEYCDKCYGDFDPYGQCHCG